MFWVCIIGDLAGPALAIWYFRYLMGAELTRPRIQAPPETQYLKDFYNASVQLSFRTDIMTWTRLAAFFAFEFVLANAWISLAAVQQSGSGSVKVMLVRRWLPVLISFIGCFVGVAWAPFGTRNRKLHNFYTDVGRALEGIMAPGTTTGPLIADRQLEESSSYNRAEDLFSTRTLVILLPLALALLFWWAFFWSLCNATGDP